MSAHEKLSCSSSHRWMKCPGSINLANTLPPEPDNVHSIAGTEAHALAEVCLKNWKNALCYLGQELSYERDGKSHTFTVTQEMTEAVQVYVDHIRERMPEKDTFCMEIYVEERFKLDWLFPESGGTSDCNVWDMEEKILYVYDYKNGEGIIVEPENNSQLMMYGLGAVHTLSMKQTEKTRKTLPPFKIFEKVVLTIVQPRAFHSDGPIRSWTIDTKALLFWALNVLKPAAEATIKSDIHIPKLVPGGHCSFCGAKAVCPGVREKAMEIAKTDFEDPIFPVPHLMSPSDILKVMGAAKLFSNWAKDVETYAFNQMISGASYPGFKLVQRKSNRKWIDEKQVEETLRPVLGEGAFTARKLISIAQAEKAFKAKGLNKATLAHLAVKPDAGITMVPVTDKRTPVSAQTPEADFKPIEDDLDFLL